MPKSEELKIILSKENTAAARLHAQQLASTPPKIVNRILSDWFSQSEGSPAERLFKAAGLSSVKFIAKKKATA